MIECEQRSYRFVSESRTIAAVGDVAYRTLGYWRRLPRGSRRVGPYVELLLQRALSKGNSFHSSTLVIDGELFRFSWPLSILSRPGDNVSQSFLNETFSVLQQLRVSRGGVFLDVGANIGRNAITYGLWTRATESGKVFAFEPVDSSFEFLRKNILDNGFTHVKVLPFGLSDEAGDRRIGMPDRAQHPRYRVRGLNDLGLYSLHATGAGLGKTSHFAPIDSFVSKEEIQRIDFIKIDTEGHELHVLRGGSETVRMFRPMLELEMNSFSLKMSRTDPGEIITWLRSFQYDLFVHSANRIAPFRDESLVDGSYAQGPDVPFLFELFAAPKNRLDR